MNSFDLKSEVGMSDFLDLLWYYVNNACDEEIICHRIGISDAVLLQEFLASFLEDSEENLKEYAVFYFGGFFGESE